MNYLRGNFLYMKKLVLLILVFAAAGFLAYKLLSDKPVKPTDAPQDHPLSISKNTPAFNTAFTALMTDYYALKDALVAWDPAKADQAAYSLAAKTDSLPVKELKGDSTLVLTAQSLAASMSGELKGFLGETGLEAKRQAFNMLTDELYNLIRTVHYDRQIVYHMHCPMAFKDSISGYWLSSVPKIVNPYLGDKHPVYKSKMLGCGEISDSLDFTK